MKKNLKPVILGVVLMFCFVLAGCSARASRDYSDWDYEREEPSYNSNLGFKTVYDSENAGDTLSDRVIDATFGIIENVLEGSMNNLIDDLTEAALKNADYGNDKGYWRHQRKSSKGQLKITEVNAKGFQIDIDMGDMNVSYGKNDTVAVNVKYIASGNKMEVVKKILQTVDIDYSIEKDTLRIFFINRNTKENIWEWIRNQYEYYNLSVELEIMLPDTVDKFEIDNSLGYIGLNSVKGTLDIHNSLGNIVLKDITFIGESTIRADLGKIECSLSKDTKEKSEVNMDNSLGDIRIDTNSLPYKKGKEDHLYDYGVGNSKAILIKKVCEMKLKVDMGRITIK